MKTIWFKRWGWLYRPVSLPGVAIVTVALLFLRAGVLAVDRKSHRWRHTLRVIPFFVCCFLVGLDRREDQP